MKEKLDLEQRIIQLKLDKRDLVLAGKDTSKVDKEILNTKRKLDGLVVANK